MLHKKAAENLSRFNLFNELFLKNLASLILYVSILPQ
jgi:hypothetical protein